MSSVTDAWNVLPWPRPHEAAKRGEIPTIRIGKRILVLVKPWRRMLEGAE
jgi:hypothetical protein